MLPVLEKRSSRVSRSLSLSINQVHSLSYLQKPLFSLFICYIAGILWAKFFGLGYLDHQILFIVCFLVFTLSLLSYLKKWRASTIFIFAFFVIIGICNTSYRLQPHGSQHIYHYSGKEGTLFGLVVQSEIKNNNRYQEIQLNAREFQYQNRRYQVDGRVLLRVYENKKKQNIENIQIGDTIKVNVVLKEPDLPDNFGEFNYRDYLVRQGIFVTGSIEGGQVEITGSSKEINLFFIIQNIKHLVNQRIEQIYPSSGRSLVKAIITGDRTEISGEWNQFFQDAGVMHILAISGLHVGILAMVLFFIFYFIPAHNRIGWLKYLIIILILFGYAAMTGFRPSVSRAALMFSIILLAKFFNRPYHLYNSLFLAALMILCWQPLFLFDAGFLLSFVVTFSIVFLAPIIQEKLTYLPIFLRKSLSVSLSAWLGMAPLSAYFFYKVSFIGILSNIIIVPLIGIILILAMISILLSFLILPVAVWLAEINQTIILLLVTLGKTLSSIPLAFRYIAQPEIYLIILYYLILIAFFYSWHFWCEYTLFEKKKRFWMIGLLVFIFIFLPLITPSLLAVHFINVGQGDCIFIQTPNGRNILIDGGGTPFSDYDVGINKVIPYLRRKGIRQIDLIFLTHPDLDHLEGLLPILREMKVNLVIDSGIKGQHQAYIDFINLIEGDENIRYYQTRAGDLIRINPELELFVLNPSGPIPSGYENDLNNHSIVLKLRYKKTNFLFTGDIENDAEANLLFWNDFLKSDILKVAHHGSNRSNSKLFIEKVRPQVAVISVGKNKFGHPHTEVMKRLAENCQSVFRTDLNGTVLIQSNGKQYDICTLR